MPPPGERFLGIHEPSIGVRGDRRHGWTASDIARLGKGAGAEIMRFEITWLEMEKTRDVWNEAAWAHYQAAYRAMLRNGIRPLIGLMIAPPWARDPGLPALCPGVRPCEYPPRVGMLPEWAEFTAEVARRFPRAAAIEIWNEPNMSIFWKPEPQPERYAALVASAYDAIKAVNPRIQVLAGSLANADRSVSTLVPPKVTMSMQEFLTRAYKATPSLAGHMDGLSFHQAGQSLRFGANSRLALAFRRVRTVRRAYDTRRTPLWITEFGLSTTDGPRVTPAVQADALLRAYRKVITIPDVAAFVLHTLGDRVERSPSDREHGVGMIESFDPFIPKPSYCAFAGRVRGQRPIAPCRRIKESLVSRCTRSLVRLRTRIPLALGKERTALRKRYARKTDRCAPGARKPKRCGPRLSRLQRLYSKAIATLRLDVLNRHERILRRCR